MTLREEDAKELSNSLGTGEVGANSRVWDLLTARTSYVSDDYIDCIIYIYNLCIHICV